MNIESFYDQGTATLTYVVWGEAGRKGFVIDSVLDYDPASGKVRTDSFERLNSFLKTNEIDLLYILETHAHADHLTCSKLLKLEYPKAKTVISKNIQKIQETFKGFFNLKDLKATGEQFDLLVDDGDKFNCGALEVEIIATPGHTPACITFKVEDCLFTGDALFMPDFGTGRCDFPAGSAEDLYHSIHKKLYSFSDETRVFVGHDYMPGGRELKFETSIGESKKSNKHVRSETSKEEFIKFRKERDAQLKAPRLLLPSIQVNIEAGKLPAKEDNGLSYLKLPISLPEGLEL